MPMASRAVGPDDVENEALLALWNSEDGKVAAQLLDRLPHLIKRFRFRHVIMLRCFMCFPVSRRPLLHGVRTLVWLF